LEEPDLPGQLAIFIIELLARCNNSLLSIWMGDESIWTGDVSIWIGGMSICMSTRTGDESTCIFRASGIVFR
jgi:hypothetical protein